LPRETDRRILCYVTDRRGLAPGDGPAGEAVRIAALERLIENAAAAGVDWIQIREKDLPGGTLEKVVRAAVARPAGAKIMVNDRLDVALATGAGGVHLGARSLSISAVRAWLRLGNAPAGFLVGASCHSLEDAAAAERAGADYLFFGPVFATPAKLEFGPPQGLDRLHEVAGGASMPVIAIGGVTLENTAECITAGAAGVAAIRVCKESQDLKETVVALRRVTR